MKTIEKIKKDILKLSKSVFEMGSANLYFYNISLDEIIPLAEWAIEMKFHAHIKCKDEKYFPIELEIITGINFKNKVIIYVDSMFGLAQTDKIDKSIISAKGIIDALVFEKERKLKSSKLSEKSYKKWLQKQGKPTLVEELQKKDWNDLNDDLPY